MIIFMTGGVLILLLVLLRYITGTHSKYSIFLRNLAIALFFSGSYIAGLVWFLRHNWLRIALHHWEYVLCYLALFAVIGIVYVQITRNDDDKKHRLKVGVKWFIRAVGVICVYNASSSPYGSLIFMCTLVFMYFTYALNKWVFGAATKKTIE